MLAVMLMCMFMLMQFLLQIPEVKEYGDLIYLFDIYLVRIFVACLWSGYIRC